MSNHQPSVAHRIVLSLVVGFAFSGIAHPAHAAKGKLELQLVDQGSGEPMAGQLQIQNAQQRIVRPPGVTQDGEWVVFDGSVVLQLPPGPYTFRLRRGLEYRERTGQFQLQSGDADRQQVDLPRIVDLTQEGWWSGDPFVMTTAWAGLPERILAADLRLVAAASWTERATAPLPLPLLERIPARIGAGRSFRSTAGWDRRPGTLLVWLGGTERLRLPTPDAGPADAGLAEDLIRAAEFRAAGGADVPRHLHVARTTCWDLPVWLAHGQVDSVGVLHDGLRERSSQLTPADRPPDPVLFPGPEGIGRWSEWIYYQILEAGLALPPAAGSGADAVNNRLGYHRTYVHCGSDFSERAWWQGLQAGRVVITNGPLLRPRVNDQLPGHRFQATAGERLQLEVTLALSTQDKIRYLEILQNGRPVHQVRLEDWAAQGGRLPPIEFTASGWLAVRAVAEHDEAYRMALSAPFYVDFDQRPRISRAAVQFFADWVLDRARQIRQAVPDATPADLAALRAARDFWQQRLSEANAD